MKSQVNMLAAAAALLAGAGVGWARQGCEPGWLRGEGLPGLDRSASSLTSFDPDGEGPQPPQLIAGGGFVTAGGVAANRIARWDGSAWHALGTGMTGNVTSSVGALTTFDPDGPGPQPAQLIAGGDFTAAGGVPVGRIARWDGSVWQGLGAGMNSAVSALTTFDPDGDGPLPLQLIAGGHFSDAGGVPASRIARWDGSAWQAMGAGMNQSVLAFATFDPDGTGPLPPQLIAGGEFTAAGGVPAGRIARWDGTAWQAMGAGVNRPVRAFATFDSDGDDGPQPPQLIAGGEFTAEVGVARNYIARWDGSSWQAMGTGMNGPVQTLAEFDADGAGPLPAYLIAGGSFSVASGVAASRVARWNGSAWQAMGAEINSGVNALAPFDPDGTGPQPPQLIAGGEFTVAGGVAANFMARLDGSAWRAMGAGINNFVEALTTFDPDGGGPQPARLIAGGSFTAAGGVPADRIANWDGSAWQSMGAGMSGVTFGIAVYALTTFDPDGDAGPLPAALIAGGEFATAGGVAANSIASWDGATWQAMGAGMNADVLTLTTFDPDGAGPQPSQLIAGGEFTAAGGVPANRIARWDGATWQALGAGMSGPVWALTTFDADGDAGPQTAQLIAGGEFLDAGGVLTNRIARWDGATWQALGAGMSGSVWALTTFDADGDAGPQTAQLIAGGVFTTAGGLAANFIARWDGSAWQAVGAGTNSVVHALAAFDPDGAGSHPPQLIAGGQFQQAGGVPASCIARWDGSAW